MEEAFWQARWRENRIGFHEAQANPLLVTHFQVLGLTPGAHVFVPLCGKSFDLDWLLAQGMRVTGIEFHRAAVQEVFARLDLTPDITSTGALTRFRAGDLTLFCGDVFALDAADLGPVQAVYDRAALIALPEPDRGRYTRHLMRITCTAPQILICLDYDQTLSDGPPFSVDATEVAARYADGFHLSELASQPMTGPISKRAPGRETVWHLAPEPV